MQPLLTAIYSKFDTVNTFNTALTGGLHLHVAPQGSSFPYAVYFIVGEAPDYYFGGESIDEVEVQFSIFTDDQSAVNALVLFEYLKALFDDCSITITDGTVLLFERTFNTILPVDPGEGEEAKWQIVVSYNITIEN